MIDGQNRRNPDQDGARVAEGERQPEEVDQRAQHDGQRFEIDTFGKKEIF